MEVHKQGKRVVLTANHEIGSALKEACDYNVDYEFIHLALAAYMS